MARERRGVTGERKEEPKRRRRPTVAAALLGAVLDPQTRRQGFVDSRLVTDWPTIIGADVARDTLPVKLDRRSRTLTLKVRPVVALTLQHEEPLLLERINAFFGTAVAFKLRLVQGPVPQRRAKPPPPPLDPEQRAAIAAEVAGVEPAPLRAALADLGAAVRARRRRDAAAAGS